MMFLLASCWMFSWNDKEITGWGSQSGIRGDSEKPGSFAKPSIQLPLPAGRLPLPELCSDLKKAACDLQSWLNIMGIQVFYLFNILT